MYFSNLVNDLKTKTFTEELNEKYKDNNGNINVNRFINDLEFLIQKFQDKKINIHLKATFISLKNLSLDRKVEERICKLGLKLILGKDFNERIRNVTPDLAQKIADINQSLFDEALKSISKNPKLEDYQKLCDFLNSFKENDQENLYFALKIFKKHHIPLSLLSQIAPFFSLKEGEQANLKLVRAFEKLSPNRMEMIASIIFLVKEASIEAKLEIIDYFDSMHILQLQNLSPIMRLLIPIEESVPEKMFHIISICALLKDCHLPLTDSTCKICQFLLTNFSYPELQEFFNGVNFKDRAQLLLILTKLNEREIYELIQIVRAKFPIKEPLIKFEILKLLAQSPLPERNRLPDLLIPLVASNLEHAQKIVIFESLISQPFYIQADCLNLFLNGYQSVFALLSVSKGFVYVIPYFFSKTAAELPMAIHAYLESLFSKNYNQNLQSEFAENMINSYSILQLSGNHPLFQKAIQIYFKCDLDFAKNFSEEIAPILSYLQGNIALELKKIFSLTTIERTDLINFLKILLPNLVGADKESYQGIFSFLKSITHKEEILIVQSLLPFFASDHQISEKLWVLSVVMNIKSEFRKDFIKLISLDFEIAACVFEILVSASVDPTNILNFIKLNSFSNVKENVHEYLNFCLVSENVLPIIKVSIAEGIIKGATLLKISEEHPMFQTALKIIISNDVDSQNDPKNPFVIFNQLQIQVPKESWMETSVVHSWNLQTLRKKGAVIKYQLSDLPEGVNETTLNDLYKTLSKRLESLEGEEKEKIKHYIMEAIGYKFEDLKMAFLTNPLIKQLVKISSSSVSSLQYQFYSILKAIFDSNNECQPGELLSMREDMLLKISVTIQACETGTRNGIETCFDLLPEKYKTRIAEKHHAPADQLIDDAIQRTFNELFTYIIPAKISKDVSQSSHTTLYLKNRLFRQLGIRHELVFDLYSKELPDELFTYSANALFSMTIENFQVEAVVKKIIKGSAELFNKKTKSFLSNVTDLIGKAEGAISGENYPQYIEIDENFAPIKLTKKGARAMLKGAGYL